MLSNREIALAIWAAIALAVCLANKALRDGLYVLLRTAFTKPILRLIITLTVYLIGVLLSLRSLGFWDAGLIKDTVIWFGSVALVTVYEAVTAEEKFSPARKWIVDNIKALVFIEFLVSQYTLSLPLELALIPVATLLSLLSAAAIRKPETKVVHTFSNSLLVIIGISLVASAAYDAYSNLDEFLSLQTAREFSNPLMLSLCLIPFLFGVNAYGKYEMAFLRINFAISNPGLRRYAKWRSLSLFFDRELLRRWLRNLVIFRPIDRVGVDRLITEVRQIKLREKNPPVVAKSQGWSPYTSKDFLREYGLITEDYHSSGAEWFSSSNYLATDDGVLPNNLYYCVEGNEDAVCTLKLFLTVTNVATADSAEKKFATLSAALLRRALGIDAGELPDEVSLEENGKAKEICGRFAQLVRKQWSQGVGGGYERCLTISCIA